jgi:hypothetical protein
VLPETLVPEVPAECLYDFLEMSIGETAIVGDSDVGDEDNYILDHQPII